MFIDCGIGIMLVWNIFYKYKPKYFFRYYFGEPTGSASGRNYSGLKGEDKS